MAVKNNFIKRNDPRSAYLITVAIGGHFISLLGSGIGVTSLSADLGS